MPANPQLVELIDALVSQRFDPMPISFRESDEQGVIPVQMACLRPVSQFHTFAKPLNRNAFLCGCLDYTEHTPIEHLIVGIGEQVGSTTRVSGIIHCIGNESSVSIPPGLSPFMRTAIMSRHKAEVLLFHNHPVNALNAIFDNEPIASRTDRDTLLRAFLDPMIALKRFAGGATFRFFIGENGFVREFAGPSLLTLLQRFGPGGAGRA